MRVLHAIASLNPADGGPVNALLGLVRAQVRLGLEVHVVAGVRASAGESVRDTLVADGASVTELKRPGGLSISSAVRSFAGVNAQVKRSELIHSHGLWSLVPTLANELSRWRSLPYVVRTCGMLDSWSLRQSSSLKRLHLALATRSMLNRAARIHVTTDRERVEVESLGLTAPVVVVPNGVDDFVFEAGTLARSSELEELRASKQLLLFLGRVDQKKGLDVLLPAMRFVRTPNVLLVVIGPRNEEHFREVRSRARELQIEDRIRFLDPLYGAQRFGAYSASEIFILPSKQENFGLSVAEAMACAVPVIVSPEVALADFVLQHGAGLAVPRDSEQLACSIDQLLDNPSLRREMGQNGRAAAQSAFRWSAIAARWKELYAELLVQHRHQHAR